MSLSGDPRPERLLPGGLAPPIRDRSAWAGVLLFVGLTTATLLCGIPFASREPIQWEGMNGPLLAGTIALAVATFWLTAVNFSPGRAMVFCALATVVSWGAECAGTQTTFPFGYQYTYHPALRPALPGDVPLFIPLAWWVLASTPLILLRGMKVCGDRGLPRLDRLLLKSLLAAVFLAGYDLVFDPLATSVEAWTWHYAGGYFGTPYLNFPGWIGVGFAIYLGYFGLESACPQPAGSPPRLVDVAWTGASLACLVLVGVAAHNRLESPLPILLSFAVIGPFWAAWLNSLRTGQAGARTVEVCRGYETQFESDG